MTYPTSSSASDVWSLRDVYKAEAGGDWPKALPIVESNLVLFADPTVSSSGTMVDRSLSGLSGTVTGATLDGSGDYYTFDGASDKIDFGSVALTAENITIWIRSPATITSATSSITFLQWDIDSGQAFLGLGATTGFVADETLSMLVQDDTGGPRTVIKDNLSANTWYSLSFNWNGSSYDIYVNNVSKTTFASNTDGHITKITTTELNIGVGTMSGAGADFTGDIGAILIYSTALTAQQMTDNYNYLSTTYS